MRKDQRYAIIEFDHEGEEVGITWISAPSWFDAERKLTETLPHGWRKSLYYIHHPNGESFYLILHEDDYRNSGGK